MKQTREGDMLVDGKPHGFARNRNRALSWLFFLVLFSPPSWSLAQEANRFYEGKTIQFLVSSGPGATTDISARLVGRYLGKHILGNPGIIVQNMPGAGGLVGANYLYNVAKRDGLTILAVSRANYLEQMVGRPEVKADFRKFGWIGSFNKAPMMAACRSDTPYKSVAAIRAAKVPPRFGQSGTGGPIGVRLSILANLDDFASLLLERDAWQDGRGCLHQEFSIMSSYGGIIGRRRF